MAKCKYKGQFGRLVIGDEAADEEKKASEGSKDVFGRLVNEPHAAKPSVKVPQETVAIIEPEPEVVHDSLSVRKVRDEVRGEVTPATIDRLMRDEFVRPDGARKSVLEILRSKEAGREAPRDEVLSALEAKIAEV